MYKSLEQEIEKTLTPKDLRLIYLVIQDDIKIFKELMEEEKDIFSGKYFKEIKARILNYIIKRSFDNELLPRTFPFKITRKNMGFNQAIPVLHKENILLTIGKTNNIESLPSPSRYKKNYAKGNNLLCRQMKFNLSKELGLEEVPYYGVISYVYNNNELNNLSILVPDNNYKHIIKNIPISIISSVPQASNKKKNYVSILDKDNLKEIVKKDIDGDNI